MTEIPSVDSLIAEQRAKKKAAKLKQIKRFLLSFGVVLALGLSIYLFIQTDFFNVKRVEVSGNQVLKTDYLQNLLWSNVHDKTGLTSGIELSKEIEHEKLIDSYKIEYPHFNEIMVLVKEHRVLAHLMDQRLLLLENSKVVEFDENIMLYPVGVPLIFGYEDEIAYERLSNALLALTAENLILVSEIKRDAKSYDVYYAHLRMMDGIQVFTALSTIHVLNDYLRIRNALNPDHDCIAIDEITAVPYSFSCAS